MSELEEKVARALAERMQINYDTMLAGERNHLHRDAQAVTPIIRKRIAQEIRDSADPVYYSSFDKSGYSQGYRAGLRHALKVVKGKDK